jgi:hypothetical protein
MSSPTSKKSTKPTSTTRQKVMSQDGKMKIEADRPAPPNSSHSSSGSAEDEKDLNVQSDDEDEVDPSASSVEDIVAAAIASATASASSPSPIRHHSGSGGLFGDSSVPATLPAPPKLSGSLPQQYSDWKLKANSYFQTNGLFEVVTMKPSESLALAIKIDGGTRSPTQITALWVRLHSKIYGTIRSATEPIIGTTFFEEIESDSTSLPITEVYDLSSISQLNARFKSGNANYLWECIRTKLQRFTPHDLATLVDRYSNLKYTAGTDPDVFRLQFDSAVRELKLAGLTLPDQLHMATWYRAIPPELKFFRQTLGAKLNLTWTEIYQSLVNEYSSSKSLRRNNREEKAHATVENKDEKRKRDNLRKGKNQLKGEGDKSTGKPPQSCNYCSKPGHFLQNCPKHKRDKAAASSTFKANKSDSENEEYGCPFIENELTASLATPEELIAVGREKSVDNSPVHFLFDSAATTHVTPIRRILHDLKESPAVTMSTAISGQNTIINKRGEVRLNDKWTLRDVAYIPKASVSLISEGRLADAGYTIIKNKDYILVQNSAGKTILRGPRANRLWVYTMDGKKPPQRPVNTIVASKPSNPEANSGSSEEKQDNPSSSIPPRRVIPKRGAQSGARAAMSS